MTDLERVSTASFTPGLLSLPAQAGPVANSGMAVEFQNDSAEYENYLTEQAPVPDAENIAQDVCLLGMGAQFGTF